MLAQCIAVDSKTRIHVRMPGRTRGTVQKGQEGQTYCCIAQATSTQLYYSIMAANHVPFLRYDLDLVTGEA